MRNSDRQQMKFDQLIENHPGGKVTIINRSPGRPPKPPAQSKGQPKSIRFNPADETAFTRAANAERVSFNEYIERCGRIGVPFSLDEVDFIVENAPMINRLLANWKILQPLLDRLVDE